MHHNSKLFNSSQTNGAYWIIPQKSQQNTQQTVKEFKLPQQFNRLKRRQISVHLQEVQH